MSVCFGHLATHVGTMLWALYVALTFTHMHTLTHAHTCTHTHTHTHRGLIPLTILKHLEKLCQLPTHQMFDYVCGTSTGAILAGLLCVKKASIAEAESLYYDMSTQVFKMNNLLGISQLFLSHAFYDEKLLQKTIR